MSEVPERLFLEWARNMITLDGTTLAEWAKKHGRSVAFVSAVLTGRTHAPEWLVAEMGASRRTVYTIPDDPKSSTCRQTAGFALLERDRKAMEAERTKRESAIDALDELVADSLRRATPAGSA